jgi:anti-sigma regulatory factor (Ser/Thr protein kinase)
MSTAGRPSSGSAPHSSRVTIVGNRDGLDRLADHYARFAMRHKLPAPVRRDMYVALEEIVSNVVRHGSRGARPREIAVRLEIDKTSFGVRIIDDGPEFDPFSAAPPRTDRSLLDRPIGGLGILLVGRLTDEHSYSRRGGRNHVVLRRALGRSGKKTRNG